MRIPADADIPLQKLTGYLLLPRPRDDKSKFLAQAGFRLDNADALRDAIRQLAMLSEATEDGESEYGRFYRVTGPLSGPDGQREVITIWLRWHRDGSWHFVTLKPDRERKR